MENDSEGIIRYTSRKRMFGGSDWSTNCNVHGKSLTKDGHCVECKKSYQQEENNDNTE